MGGIQVSALVGVLDFTAKYEVKLCPSLFTAARRTWCCDISPFTAMRLRYDKSEASEEKAGSIST